jgi:quinol monooxygenase YgiN
LHAEPDNLHYGFWVDQAEPGRSILDELQDDPDALVAHCGRVSSETFLASINNLAARSALTLESLAIG